LNLREKIQSRLDELESLMQTQTHLENPELVTETLESVTKFWSVLSEEEREFVSAARIALNEATRYQ
jgi:uncharacterized protein YydD (DUF2326 family)